MLIIIIGVVVCIIILCTNPAAKQTEAQMRTPSGFVSLILLLALLAVISVVAMGLAGTIH